jgi:hypothetical protein
VAETVGSLVDKISITSLKIFHMQKQVERTDATQEHRENCARRVTVLTDQRNDLEAEVTELLSAVLSGKKTMKVYRQFKMYNDPAYRPKS